MKVSKFRAVLVVGLAGVTAASCGSSKGSSTSAGTSPPSSAQPTTASCKGAPIVVGQIASATGTFSYPDVPVAANVAVHAVNQTCEDGRPLKLVTCDDRSDPNTAVTCAHELVSDHVVAMVGNASPQLSQAMAITQAAGIPSVFNAGISPWEFTSKLSYPLSVSLVQAVAVVHAAVGSGAKSIEFLAGDQPQASQIVGLLTSVAKPLGVPVIPVLYPPSTTDFAPVAAQAIAAKPGAIFVASGGSQVQPLFRALGQQGLASRTLLMTAAALFTPATVAALGSAVNDLYVLSAEALPVDSTATNTGITQMRKEYTADGQNANKSDMTGLATLAWTGVHVLADALKSQNTITPATVEAALLAVGTVSQPQIPTWNASKNALPQVPALTVFRVLSDSAFWYRVQSGKFVPVGSGSIPAAHTFNLAAKP